MPCPDNEKYDYDYDYALIYKGILGYYLYYIKIDGQQHFNDRHWFNYDKNHDIIKTIKNSYMIRIDYKNVDNTANILRSAFNKWLMEYPLTTSDPDKYRY